MERAKALFGKATFVMERGYDDSKMFLKLDSMKQDYGIRLTAKRKLLYHNKWVFATELRNRRTIAEQAMSFLGHTSMKSKTNLLKVVSIQTANPIKENISFCYYRLAKGISGILSYAKEGIRRWFRIKRPAYRQLCLKLAV